MPAPLAKRLHDNRSAGAANLARGTVAMLRELVIASKGGPDLPARTRLCAETLAAARSAMGAVGNLVRLWTDSCPSAATDFAARAVDHCDAVRGWAEQAFRETVGMAFERL